MKKEKRKRNSLKVIETTSFICDSCLEGEFFIGMGEIVLCLDCCITLKTYFDTSKRFDKEFENYLDEI